MNAQADDQPRDVGVEGGARFELPPDVLAVVGGQPLRRFAKFPGVPLTASDVDAVLDAVVRVAIPFLSGLFVLLAASAVVSVFSWPAAVALLASALIAGVAAPWLAARISSRADEAAISGRGALADAVQTAEVA